MKGKRTRPKKSAKVPVALGAVARENLPLPVVHYPQLYGAFFAFTADEASYPFLCACSEPAIKNYLRSKEIISKHIKYGDVERTTPLDEHFFPKIITRLSLQHLEDPLALLKFKKGLCHRCNLITPSLRYCHEMYGEQFMQQYGWYVTQTYLRLGIDPNGYFYLPDECPEEYQEDIIALKKAQEEYNREEQRIMEIVHGPNRAEIPADEKTYMRNLRREEASEMIRLKRQRDQVTRAFTKKIENIVRQEFGFRKVGEGWVSETILYQIVQRIFVEQKIIFHYRPEWLDGLELDVYIPKLKLALEYQGQQHFHAVKAWGGEPALKMLQRRDARKAEMCRQQMVKLVTIDYTEPLTEQHIRQVLSDR